MLRNSGFDFNSLLSQTDVNESMKTLGSSFVFDMNFLTVKLKRLLNKMRTHYSRRYFLLRMT
jgi:hypothetical protein